MCTSANPATSARSRRRIAAVAAAALLAVAGQAFGAAGRFIAVVGDVQLVAANGQVQQVARGASLERGDAVITGSRGLAQLRMSDGGMLSVRPNSEMKVDDYAFEETNAGAGKMFLRLLRGGLRSITGLIGSRNRSGYRISTPHATIGVRGTDHETTVLLAPREGFAPGTFDVVYQGATIMRSGRGTINIAPQQAGYVSAANVVPRVLNVVPQFLKPAPQGAAPRATPPAQRGDSGGNANKQSAPALRRAPNATTPAKPGALRPNAVLPLQQRTTPSIRSNTLAPSTRPLVPSTTTLSPSITTRTAPTTFTAPSTSTLTAPTTTIAPSTSTLTAPTTTIAPSTSTLTAPTTTVAPSTSTLTAPTTTIAPSTSTLTAPTTTLSPSIQKLAPSTGTLAPMSTPKSRATPINPVISPAKSRLAPSTQMNR